MITNDELKNGNFIFLPETAIEAGKIQSILFSRGFTWASGKSDVSSLDACVSTGMILKNGYLYYSPISDDRRTARHLSLADLTASAPKAVSEADEVAKLRADFNVMAEQFKAQQKMIEELHALLVPREGSSRVLNGAPKKKPQGGATP